VENVRLRLPRAAAALEAANVPYAVIGGNAVAAWVARVDEGAVRNTRDVDILLRRSDLPRAIEALANAGFVHRHVAGEDLFLDGPEGRARDAVHVVFAAEKAREEYPEPAPDPAESAEEDGYRVLSLEALVRMKLTSFRERDRVHLRDMADVGLVDAGWLDRLSPILAARVQQILDTPDG
jgi:hypothetical protein